jgi:DTW domain-containing protein YfiP
MKRTTGKQFRVDVVDKTMNQIFRGRCRCLCRTKIVSVRLVLFLLASAHASFRVRSSFGNAFVLSPSPRLCHRLSNDNTQNQKEHPQSGRRSPTTTTTSFVFSRLGDDNGVSSRRKGHEATNTKSSSAATTSTRGYCPKCKRPGVVCICHALPDTPIDCGTRILILQHPREARKRKRTSTVPLIGLSVRNVEICVGTTFQEGSHPMLDEALTSMNDVCDGDDDASNTHPHALLLYPSERALPLQTYLETARNTSRETATKATTDKPQPTGLTSSNSNNNNNSRILVVVDGTWAQTQSMVQNSHNTLRKLPNVMFDDDTDSLFDSLRQEPAKHCTSTLEAVSRAIRLLGAVPLVSNSRSTSESGSSSSETTYARAADALERSLKAMVDGQLNFALDQKTAKPRYCRKNEHTGKEYDDETTANNDEQSNTTVSKREAKRTRRMVSRSLRAGLTLSQPKTKEELEFERIRFVFVAHLG